MFSDYVYEKSGAENVECILLIDDGCLDDAARFSEKFVAHGFELVRFEDDLGFRVGYEEKLKSGGGRMAVLACSKDYVPYDLRSRMHVFDVSLRGIFPRLDEDALRDLEPDLDLLCMAYRDSYDILTARHDTERFVREKVYGRDNVARYLDRQGLVLTERAKECDNYREWLTIAEEKAKLDVMAVENDIVPNTAEINELFCDWAVRRFGSLSSELDPETPVLVGHAMEFMHERSGKFAIVVMDGMSEFDWHVLSRSFRDVEYEKTSAFAMIPTVTSVSRQCLLSNKYPVQLQDPWSQAKEKNEFMACAREMGFTDAQIGYARGYDADFGALVRCAAIIIMDVDDLVHGQKQGRIGMLNDVDVMAKQKKLVGLVGRLLEQGFDVYISADHGNTPCTGLGRLMGSGVETETRSRRMLVLKDFADKNGIMAKYGMVEYPKYFLPKEYDYLICGVGMSLDARGEDVVSHGGITIDEVVVPFIRIKAV